MARWGMRRRGQRAVTELTDFMARPLRRSVWRPVIGKPTTVLKSDSQQRFFRLAGRVNSLFPAIMD